MHTRLRWNAIARLASRVLGILGVCLSLASKVTAADAPPLKELLDCLPPDAGGLSWEQTERLLRTAERLEAWSAEIQWQSDRPAEIFAQVAGLVDAKARVDKALGELLALRTQFAAGPGDDRRRESLRQYLQGCSSLIDLSGRLRYRLRDVCDGAAAALAGQPEGLRRLLRLMTEQRVSIAATSLAGLLFDPPPDSGAAPFPEADKYQVLQLIDATRPAELIPTVAAFLRTEKNPGLVVIAAELLRRLGLPQTPRPQSDPTLPAPPILAEEVQQILTAIDPQRLSPTLRDFRLGLMQWTQSASRHGVTEERYRIGRCEVQAGDWLLMRNPSPYNLFTDLSPGLFTHVGLVAVEQGSDGIRRFVIVDLPERGTSIPATPVDAYLQRTLHFFFLRHEDAEVCRGLGQAAGELIGNESQFDLNFRTSRIRELQGRPLRGAAIHTYCAGLLLIAAQQTGRPREEFFPIVEAAAGGHTPGQPAAHRPVARRRFRLADRRHVLAAAEHRRAARADVRSGPRSPGSGLRSLRILPARARAVALARRVPGLAAKRGRDGQRPSVAGPRPGPREQRQRASGPGSRGPCRDRRRDSGRNRRRKSESLRRSSPGRAGRAAG